MAGHSIGPVQVNMSVQELGDIKYNFSLQDLYVEDQKRSREFYQELLMSEPVLDVPGMTEFRLSDAHILGLMPEKGIKKRHLCLFIYTAAVVLV